MVRAVCSNEFHNAGIGRKDIARAFDGAELALLSHGCGASLGGWDRWRNLKPPSHFCVE